MVAQAGANGTPTANAQAAKVFAFIGYSFREKD
jgi:hypothetical protein